MPIPKGINDPAVRALWLAGRRDKLAEFDRLVGKCYTPTKAARTIGMTLPGVHSLRRSLAGSEENGRQHGGPGGTNIDLGLALLSVLRHPGERLTCEDIAAWCDCRPQSIAQIEQRALRKLRLRLQEDLQRAEAEDVVLRFPDRAPILDAA